MAAEPCFSDRGHQHVEHQSLESDWAKGIAKACSHANPSDISRLVHPVRKKLDGLSTMRQPPRWGRVCGGWL